MQFRDLYQVRSLQQTTTSEPLVSASLKQGGVGETASTLLTNSSDLRYLRYRERYAQKANKKGKTAVHKHQQPMTMT